MSERRSQDNDIRDECREGQKKAVATLESMQSFMASSLNSIITLTDRVSKNEAHSEAMFNEIFKEHVGIKEEHEKIRSLISESQCRNDDGFDGIIKKIDALSESTEALSIKEKARRKRDLAVKGFVCAVILSFAVMGVYSVGAILFGEDRVQEVINLSKGNVK